MRPYRHILVREATREPLVDEFDAIRDGVHLCLDGEAKGDVAKLQEAFHQHARILPGLHAYWVTYCKASGSSYSVRNRTDELRNK
jgi:hypothetical protein